MANTKETLEYADYNLAGNINQKYHDIVNCRVVKPPYSKRLGHNSFFLDKRFGFTDVTKGTCHDCLTIPVPPIDNQHTIFDGGTIEDVIEMDSRKFYMWVNNDKTVMKIYVEGNKPIGTGGDQLCCFYKIGPDLCTRQDGYFRFLTTNFVKGLPKDIFGGATFEGTTGIQVNDVTSGLVDAKFRDSSVPGTNNFNTVDISVGDYVYTHSQNSLCISANPGFPGQVSQITGVTASEIDVLTPRAGFAPSQTEGECLEYRIYPEWGEVFVVDTCDGLQVYTFGENLDDIILGVGPIAALNPFLPTGLTLDGSDSVGINNGRINYLTTDGDLNFGGTGTQVFYRTADQSIFVGTDVIAAPTFQQYTLLFKEKGLSVVRYVINDDGTVSFEFGNSDMNIGLFDKYSYTNYKSSFYFLGSNKRLYALSITPTTYGTFTTQLEDMSALIKGELDNILPTDQVRIQGGEQDLKIYINSDFRGSGIFNKTKVLIYDKDYQFWHKWEVCGGQISGDFCGQKYFGGSVYNLCGDTDFYNCDIGQGVEFEQRLTVMFGENEVGDNPVNLRQPKRIVNPKFIMGQNSNLTNGNFYIEFDMLTNCYKPKWRIANPEKICYVNILNKIKAGDPIFPNKDALRLLNKCSSYNNPCEGSGNSYTNLIPSNRCGCPDERPVFEDYCVCVNEETYFLSQFSKVSFFPPKDIEANLYKIDIVAKGTNNIEFGGLMLPYYRKNPDERDLAACDNRWQCTCSTECTCADVLATDCGCD